MLSKHITGHDWSDSLSYKERLLLLATSFILVFNLFFSKEAFWGWAVPASVNVMISVLSGLVLFGMWWLKRSEMPRMSLVDKAALALLLVILAQAIFREPLFMQLVGVGTLFFLLVIYLYLFPRVIPPSLLVSFLKLFLYLLAAGSVLLMLFGEGNLFEGGRFSGLFKNSVVMGEYALIGAIVFIVEFGRNKKAHELMMAFLFLFLVVMAGSRSLFLCALAVQLVAIFTMIYKAKSASVRVLTACAVIAFFAYSGLAYNVATGKFWFGPRAYVTNGVADRVQHWNYVLSKVMGVPDPKMPDPGHTEAVDSASPAPAWSKLWIWGEGVLVKYTSPSGDIGIEHFREYYDPHNLFLYAFKVGGAPVLAIVLLLYFLLGYYIYRSFGGRNYHQWLFSMLLLPLMIIFFVGGSLVSLGSVMDRVYWLLMGYLGLMRRYK